MEGNSIFIEITRNHPLGMIKRRGYYLNPIVETKHREEAN